MTRTHPIESFHQNQKPTPMIKILHTSDLHIGKRLYQEELAEDQSLFFEWLTALIRKEGIHVLLISGDVFDVANPSSESRRMYYGLLRDLMQLSCRVIITEGNHDSPAVLEAPRELLKHLSIHVVGGYQQDAGRLLIPLGAEGEAPEAVVAALPFLRDGDLRRYTANETYEDRTEAVREGIAGIYAEAAAQCRKHYPGLPALAMGHLYLQGGSLSDSEREIQIGNLAGLETSALPDYFSYYALGHLHKPQEPLEGRMVYSGSPVKLSFSESKNNNRVMLITVDGKKLSAESIPLPETRRLLRFRGSVEELKARLDSHTDGHLDLKDFIELEAVEETNDPSYSVMLEEMVEQFKRPGAKILNYRITAKNKVSGTASLYGEAGSITELKPLDVFDKRMESENIEESTRLLLREAFLELLEEVEQQTMEE